MRALVLSGGGSLGQYHLGTLRYLYEVLKLQHPIISGVSVGALLGSYLAQFSFGCEEKAITELLRIFTPLQTRDIYRSWFPAGLLHGFFNKKSFYDSTPLNTLITKKISAARLQSGGHILRVGVTLLSPDAGINSRVYTEKDPAIVDAVKASAVYAPFFTPIHLENAWAIDGGIQATTPIKAAIIAGATAVDVVTGYPPTLSFKNKTASALDVALFVVELLYQKLTWSDIEQTQRINDLVLKNKDDTKRFVALNVFCPRRDLGVNSLIFNPEEARRLQLTGYEDARTAYLVSRATSTLYSR